MLSHGNAPRCSTETKRHETALYSLSSSKSPLARASSVDAATIPIGTCRRDKGPPKVLARSSNRQLCTWSPIPWGAVTFSRGESGMRGE